MTLTAELSPSNACRDEAELAGRLRAGRPVYVRAWGCSMLPALRPGERLRIEPLGGAPIRQGEIVLTEDGGGVRIHRVIAVSVARVVTQGDALPRPDAAVRREAVLGRVTLNLDAEARRWQRAPSRARRWFYSRHGADWWSRAGRMKTRLTRHLQARRRARAGTGTAA